MTIDKTLNGTELYVKVSGRLDTNTSPELEEQLNSLIPSVENLVIDFAELDYISSAGLRVLLSAHKKVSLNGKMVIKNINDVVSEVFEVTGFKDILNIE